MTELSRCSSFCVLEPKFNQSYGNVWLVECGLCFIHTKPCKTKDDAIAEWNNRHNFDWEHRTCPSCGGKASIHINENGKLYIECETCHSISYSWIEKPCPFCGGEAVFNNEELHDEIKCKECGAYLSRPYQQCISREHHMPKWNLEYMTKWNMRVQHLRNVMLSEVRNCPLCRTWTVELSFGDRRVYCPQCGISTKCFTLGTYKDAIESWNRRNIDE